MEGNVGLAFVLVLEALVEGVQPSTPGVVLDLAIPSIGSELAEPGTQFGEIVLGEPADGTLNVFDGAHVGKIKPFVSGEQACKQHSGQAQGTKAQERVGGGVPSGGSGLVVGGTDHPRDLRVVEERRGAI